MCFASIPAAIATGRRDRGPQAEPLLGAALLEPRTPWARGSGVRSQLPMSSWKPLAVPSHDIGSPLSGLASVGREAVGERDDEAAQFIWAFDDKRPVE